MYITRACVASSFALVLLAWGAGCQDRIHTNAAHGAATFDESSTVAASPGQRDFDIFTVSEFNTPGASAAGVSNGVAWKVCETSFSGCCGANINGSYNGYNTSNFAPPVAGEDVMHVGGSDMTIVFDRPVDDVVFYMRENGGISSLDFGEPPVVISGGQNLNIVGNRIFPNTSGGTVRIENIQSRELVALSQAVDGMDLAFYVESTAPGAISPPLCPSETPPDEEICEQPGEPGDWHYCSAACPCDDGEGDCDSDDECVTGTICVKGGIGAEFGYDPDVDICLATCHRSALGGANYCAPDCPCDEGEGDCDGDDECAPGLACARNVGEQYGFESDTDVCVPQCQANDLGDSDFCSPECPCDDGQGDCDGDADCAAGLRCVRNVGAEYGFDEDTDVCLATCHPSAVGGFDYCSEECPCDADEGDCDSDSECVSGLVCVKDVGADYGWDEDVDVCLPDGASACDSSTSQVPPMTSSTSPSGMVARSGVLGSSYEAWKAFDNSTAGSSLWLSQIWQAPAWLSYEWANGNRLIERYEIYFRNGSRLATRAPRDWTFQGWDGSQWITLDIRTNQTGWLGEAATRTFDVANPGRYAKYRLHVTRDNDSRSDIVVVSIAQLVLYGCE